MTLEKIIEKFVDAATKHTLASLEGDYKRGNRENDKLMKIYNVVKDMGKQTIFLPYLNHPNEGVRLWAAVFSLKTYPELGTKCLKDLIQLETITGLSAETTLSEWEKGNLELL